MEIFDWDKLEYDPFLLQVYHQSMVLCQLYKEDLNLFLPLCFKKRLGAIKFLPAKSTRTFQHLEQDRAPGRNSKNIRCEEKGMNDVM